MKILHLGISALIYLGFLAVFTYLLVFVGGNFISSYLPFPDWLKTIDSGPVLFSIPGIPDGLNNLFLLLAFGLQHSLMARQRFKSLIKRVIPLQLERSLYVLATCIVLCWWYLGWKPMLYPVWTLDGALAILMQVLFFTGAALVLWSTFLISHWHLFGLAQTWEAYNKKPPCEDRLIEPGLYRYSRHPMYVGILMVLWFTPTMTFGHFMAASVLTTYVFIGIGYEERDLLKQFGDAYRDYMERVPQLLPFGRHNAD